jgi:hypothetical protein
MSGGMLLQPYGWLLGLSGNATVVDSVTTYSAADFTRANSMMLVGLVIALIASLLIKETHCKQLNQKS